MLAEKWYLRSIPLIIPIEYFCWRIFGIKGFSYIVLHFIVFVLPIINFFIEKFEKDSFLKLYL